AHATWPSSRGSRGSCRLVPPHGPAITRGSTEELELGQLRVHALNDLVDSIGLGAVLGAGRADHRRRACRGGGCRRMPLRAHKQQLVLLAGPVAHADLLLVPDKARSVLETPRPQNLEGL